MRKWIPLALIVIALIVSIAVYPQLPDRVPTHWNTAGEVNGWSSRLWGAWMLPLIMAHRLAHHACDTAHRPAQGELRRSSRGCTTGW